MFFSFCWIKDAEHGSWFTSDGMDLAEWFNSSPAAGCRKILSHFTERMFLLSFLVITYLHELAQLGGSGGSCVAPSVCISYRWFGGQIRKPQKKSKGFVWLSPQRARGHCHFTPKLWIRCWEGGENSAFVLTLIPVSCAPCSYSQGLISELLVTHSLCDTKQLTVQQILAEWLMGPISWLKSILVKLMTVILASLHQSQRCNFFPPTKTAPIQKWNN